ncbi:MAG: hypothetical protein QOD32_88, partial [Pyrinomonadaceae bacterium]|nr:hypothetical protein [Pyrinomonadaceae bacterium]
MSRAVRAGVRASVCLCAAASLLLVASNNLIARGEGVVGSEMSIDGRIMIVRLRSFAPRATGRLEVEPTAGGGRVHLTALNLPTPQSLAPNARTFVAWASGGRILRLGELRRGARGTGSLVFPHPAEFARYSLIVTAEPDARAERPTGAPVFSTRANEVAALFPDPPANVDDNARANTTTARRERRATPTTRRAPTASTITRRAPTASTPSDTTGVKAANETNTPRPSSAAATTTLRTRGRVRAGSAEGEFFTTVDEAINNDATARTLVLVGDRGARRARGTARVATTNDGTA